MFFLYSYGLNTDSNPNDNKGLNYWCSPDKHYILVHDENQINGGNLKNILDQTTGVNFVMEYVTSNQYNVYLYSSQDSKKAEGTKIVVYKQGIYRENSSSIWIAGYQQVGWSAVQGGYLKTTTGEKTTGQIVWEEGPIP